MLRLVLAALHKGGRDWSIRGDPSSADTKSAAVEGVVAQVPGLVSSVSFLVNICRGGGRAACRVGIEGLGPRGVGAVVPFSLTVKPNAPSSS